MIARRRTYVFFAATLFAVLALIALFVRDDIVRPYGGDFLVVIFLYLLVRAVAPLGRWQSAALVFVFACAVEAAQAFGLVARVGLAWSEGARVVIGTHADLADIAMYAAGVVCAALLDRPRPD